MNNVAYFDISIPEYIEAPSVSETKLTKIEKKRAKIIKEILLFYFSVASLGRLARSPRSVASLGRLARSPSSVASLGHLARLPRSVAALGLLARSIRSVA